MRIEDYELNHMNREYKINTISLRFLVAITILTAIFLVYAVHSTIKTRNEIEAAQESLAIRASQLQSDLEELKREIEATPTPTTTPTPIPTTILTEEPIGDLWIPEETEPSYVISFTDKERTLFEQIVEAEAHPTWAYEGYFLIAQTVMNQLADGYWGNSLYDVLTYPANYAVYSNGRYKQVAVTDNAKAAVEEVLQGTKPISMYEHGHEKLESILYFCTQAHLQRTPSGFHASQTEVMRYDNVVFFAKKG